jgi:hypothetical protein
MSDWQKTLSRERIVTQNSPGRHWKAAHSLLRVRRSERRCDGSPVNR